MQREWGAGKSSASLISAAGARWDVAIAIAAKNTSLIEIRSHDRGLGPRPQRGPGAEPLAFFLRRQHLRDVLERLALRIHAHRPLGDRARPHQHRRDQVADAHRPGIPSSDQPPEDVRRHQPARRGPERVEHRDRQGAGLERENLARGQVGAARGRRGHEEDRHPQQRLRQRIQVAETEQDCGDGEQHRGRGERAADHPPPSPRVEQRPQQERPEQIARGQRQDVQPHMARRHLIEIRQHHPVGEEDRVEQERLAQHQDEHQRAALAVRHEHRMQHHADPEHASGVDRHGLVAVGQVVAEMLDPPLDRGGRASGVALEAMRDEPARALGHETPQPDHRQAEQPADREADAPADPLRQDAAAGHQQRGAGPDRRPRPVARIHRQVDAAAQPRRHHLIHRGVDRGVFTTDPQSRDDPRQREGERTPRTGRAQHADHVDPERDREDRAAADAVGEPAEEQRTDHGAAHVSRGGRAELGRRHVQRLVRLQRRADRPHDRDLEPVQDPGDAQGDQHLDMKTAERQPVEPGRNVGRDRGTRRIPVHVRVGTQALASPILVRVPGPAICQSLAWVQVRTR